MAARAAVYWVIACVLADIDKRSPPRRGRPEMGEPVYQVALSFAEQRLLEKRRPVMQHWADCIAENAAEP